MSVIKKKFNTQSIYPSQLRTTCKRLLPCRNIIYLTPKYTTLFSIGGGKQRRELHQYIIYDPTVIEHRGVFGRIKWHDLHKGHIWSERNLGLVLNTRPFSAGPSLGASLPYMRPSH